MLVAVPQCRLGPVQRCPNAKHAAIRGRYCAWAETPFRAPFVIPVLAAILTVTSTDAESASE